MRFTNPLSCLAALTALVLALAGSVGCRTTPIQRDMMSDALTAGEQPVAMRGEGALLDGKLTAIATVSRGFGQGSNAKGGSRDGRAGRNSERAGIADSYQTGFGDSADEQKEAMAAYMRMVMAQRAAGSPMPPVTLRLQFENHGTEPLEIEVTEVNSELGNFAVRPPKLTLASGQAGAVDPMISQLGVTSDEIPVKVEIRHAGKRETTIVTVKNLILPSVKK